MITVLPKPLTATDDEFGPVVVIGVFDDGTLMTADSDGQLNVRGFAHIKVDWRYDIANGVWVDVSPIEELDEETPDDGGEEVPGDLPDADGTDGGREDRREGGADWRLDPREADTEGVPI